MDDSHQTRVGGSDLGVTAAQGNMISQFSSRSREEVGNRVGKISS